MSEDQWWESLRKELILGPGSNRSTGVCWLREFRHSNGDRIEPKRTKDYLHQRLGPAEILLLRVPGMTGDDSVQHFLEYAWKNWRCPEPYPMFGGASKRHYIPLSKVRWEWQGLGLLGAGIWTSGPAVYIRSNVGPVHPAVLNGAAKRGIKDLDYYVERYFLNGERCEQDEPGVGGSGDDDDQELSE
jgi:hypothetical protein